MDNRIAVETDLFEHRQVKPHFINPFCFGEDFATWLKESLSHLNFQLSDIIQEDYGWGFWATLQKDRFWIALSYVGDGPQEPPPRWIITVASDPGLNLVKRLFQRADQQSLERLRAEVRHALTSEPRIKVVPLPRYDQ